MSLLFSLSHTKQIHPAYKLFAGLFLILFLIILYRYMFMYDYPDRFFPCFFLSCKANARVKPAKTGHGPHPS